MRKRELLVGEREGLRRIASEFPEAVEETLPVFAPEPTILAAAKSSNCYKIFASAYGG
jgi:hypothetical protein